MALQKEEGATHVKVSALRIEVPFFSFAQKMHLLVVYAIKIRHTQNIFFLQAIKSLYTMVRPS